MTLAINIGLATVLVLLAVSIWRVGRRIPKQAEQRRPSIPGAAPVVETTPGVNVGDLDECQLIWATPYGDVDAGVERLLAAIRDERQEEAGDA